MFPSLKVQYEGEDEFVAFQAEGEHQEWTMGQTNLKAGVANVSFTVVRLAGMNIYMQVNTATLEMVSCKELINLTLLYLSRDTQEAVRWNCFYKETL